MLFYQISVRGNKKRNAQLGIIDRSWGKFLKELKEINPKYGISICEDSFK